MVFGDPQLNALEEAALAHNPMLTSAAARVAQARAQLGLALADRQPSLTLSPTAQLEGESASQRTPFPFRQKGQNYNVPLTASYEVDLWGRVRRATESANAQLAASEEDRRAVALTLTTSLAQSYYQLRALTAEVAVVRDTLKARTETVEVQTERYNGGLIYEYDLVSAREELATAEADLADLQRRQEETVDSLATLTGVAPTNFNFALPADVALLPPPPTIPAGLPSDLLQRRPDVVEAERTLAAKTASIGVAQAAKFPKVLLNGSAGFQSVNLGTLFSGPSEFWNIGPSITLPLLDGGRNEANLAAARAVADGALADYQQQVLTAFREVEDALVDLNRQAEQAAAQERAEVASREAAELTQARYNSGLVNYLQVVDTERDLLANQRTRVQVAGERYASTLRLIQALGGGWN
jgi:multidrug efflux system outer membrane protein